MGIGYSADNQCLNNEGLLAFFRVKVEELETSSIKSYRKALASLYSFLASRTGDADLNRDETLADWFVHLFMKGVSFKTSCLYLDIVSGLYTNALKEGVVTGENPFGRFRTKVRTTGDAVWSNGLGEQDFRRVMHTTKAAERQNGERALATDLLLFSLLNGCMDLGRIARLRKEDIGRFDGESAAVLRRRAVPKRKYVFDLSQSDRTPRQLEKFIAGLIQNLCLLRNLPMTGTVKETIESYWAYAALKCGASGSDIVAALGAAPKGIPVLSLYGRPETPTTVSRDLSDEIGLLFIGNALRWYAMRLRPRVRFEEIEARLEQLEGEVNRPQLFYPYDEIAKKTGKKIVMENKPVISDVAFFRCRVTDIFPLFCKIGDLAWCYTSSGRPGSPYAVIPEDNFRKFQETIGHFTSEYRVAPMGTMVPREGEKVVFLGGLFGGQEIDISKVEEAAGASNIYRLSFDSQNGIDWKITVDKRLVKTVK